MTKHNNSFPGGAVGKQSACRCRRCQRRWFDPWVGKIPWRRKWQPASVFLSGNSMGRGAWLTTVHGATKSLTQLITQGVPKIAPFLQPRLLSTPRNSNIAKLGFSIHPGMLPYIHFIHPSWVQSSDPHPASFLGQNLEMPTHLPTRTHIPTDLSSSSSTSPTPYLPTHPPLTSPQYLSLPLWPQGQTAGAQHLLNSRRKPEACRVFFGFFFKE